ncbi:glycosyltransferase [candidate division KSB3 bacterium]|uniref:Glycosyltransferase n=1 Tax=candidate division KSB3 bacterium TaxID=2044937 RepID=A0A2G6E7S2_9BACT|nr:MAG: glycosyltransferase [candidate division KSB3 bacterium]PIE30496.1 MAG: glycosyltransferase [candidate division KSB3 bacterium]
MLETSTVSVIVPVYNGQESLDALIHRIQSVLEPLVQAFEILLVNDGSDDASWEVITSLATQYHNVRGINLMRNYGQHNALLAGIYKAQYELIVTLDDDLQHPPEEIPKLLSTLMKGYDLVYGIPAARQHESWRNLSSKALRVVLKIVAGSKIADKSSAFRAFRSVLRQSFAHFRGRSLSLDVLLSWGSDRVAEVFVDHHSRRHGTSGYTLGKLLLLAFDMLIGYSTLPLRIASGIGLATSLLSLIMLCYVVIRRLFQHAYVPDVSFLAAEIAFFAGMQLFAVGIIGEYIARLHFRTMGKPPYVIRDDIGNGGTSTAVPLHAVKETRQAFEADTPDFHEEECGI